MTIGSRGDVQPYIALGVGLADAGYDVRIATHALFEPFVRAYGLDFIEVANNPRDLLESADGQGWLHADRNPIQFLRYFLALAKPQMEQHLDDALRAAKNTDAMIYAVLAFGGHFAAQAHNIPSIRAYLQPFSRTKAFPAVAVPPWLYGGGWSNYISHWATEQMLWQPFRKSIDNLLRQKTGKPSGMSAKGPFYDLRDHPILYGYSPSVLPHPADWPSHYHATGYWYLQAQKQWQPPADLLAFLETGEKPLYIGFGSMADGQTAELTDIVHNALRLTGERAIVLSGWAGLSPQDSTRNMFVVDNVPHDWLFPRMKMVVHHGGAGTTAVGLRSGIPSLLIPFFADQHFWGHQVQQLGAGPPPVPRRDLTATKLADRIWQAVHNPTYAQQARALGQRIQAEDGVQTAVRLIQRYLTSA